MTDIVFTRAHVAMLDDICDLYKDATDHLNALGIYQWDEKYPTRDILEEDIRSGNLYVSVCSGRLSAAYVLNNDADIEYQQGNWESEGVALILHRLCVHPDFQGKGLGRSAVLDAERRAAKSGANFLRLDTFEKNYISTKMYASMGYRPAGSVTFRMGTFYLYEKAL